MKLSSDKTPYIEPVVGRYLHLELQGKPHRVYFEESGQGVPLLNGLPYFHKPPLFYWIDQL